MATSDWQQERTLPFMVDNARLLLSTEEESFEYDWLYDEEVADVVDLEHLKDQIEQLAQERNRYISKKDSVKQKAGFKEILKSIEAGYTPEVKLTFHQQTVLIDDWVKIKQYNAIREALGGGFQCHFLNNELLSEIFGVQISANNQKEKLTGQDKRIAQSVNSFSEKNRARGRGCGFGLLVLVGGVASGVLYQY
eukprot:TRINITY_DN2420_c0_g1_i2.p1 TRINITY_DN2420_c0_g1~~TRINITY_DN2420_c0_g1_i2.p1  ORF type:complete len:194 (-),score=58.84 TRINITY_DN2420_c0_g1_i2:37-618(-)